MNVIQQTLWRSLLAACLGAVLCVLAGGAMAADYYVTPTGAGDYGGTNWHNAYSNVQTAASLATNAGGDTIFLRWGVYSNASQIVISNAANLSVIGGCKGLSGVESNAYSGTNSTLTRTGGTMRIVYGCDSVVTMACVTVSGGYFSSGTNNGAGLYFTNCAVTLTNCAVRDNTNICTGSSYGGGLFAVGGSLTIFDGLFFNNTLTSAPNVSLYGGGIAAMGCPLVVRGSASVFSNNVLFDPTTYAKAYGGAIFVTNAPLTVEDATFFGNQAVGGVSGNAAGGAIYHTGTGMPATIVTCRFATNSAAKTGAGGDIFGGAVFLAGATGVVANCWFSNNIAYSGQYHARGGAICAFMLQSLRAVSNEFYDNRVAPVGMGGLQGGACYTTNCAVTVFESCWLGGNATPAGTAPELVYLGGGGTALFLNSTLRNNKAGHGLVFAGAAGSTLAVSNCVLMGHSGNGLILTNGSAGVFNCLVARNVQDGLAQLAGTVTVANCTLADNGGWGLSWTAGTGTVVNSIAWGNVGGGFASNANLGVTYSCSQNAPYGEGTGNLIANPLFVSVPDCYYLSVSGLTGQAVSSPCVDTGSGTAAAWGLTNRTTRTDGASDSGPVDMGYHATNGAPDSAILTLTNCYVDAANGSDASGDGLTWTSAWRSITHALTNVALDATINMATGMYSAAATGEEFPLTVRMPGLTLAASNANPALTALDNARTNGQRVLQASGMRTVALRGLTFRGGSFSGGENRGGALCFEGIAVTLSNCVVSGNSNLATSGGSCFGGGMYCNGGSLSVFDTCFSNNLLQGNGLTSYGGGLCAVNAVCLLDGCVFWGNCAQGIAPGYGFSYGAGIYGTGPSARIVHCRFIGNYAGLAGASGAAGGAMFASWSTAIVADCVIGTNYATGNGGQPGGGVYGNGSVVTLSSNYFVDNYCPAGTASHGAALLLSGCATAIVNSCMIEMKNKTAGADHLYIDGIRQTFLLNTTLQGNRSSRGVFFAGVAGSDMVMSNTLLANNSGDGLYMSTGTVTVVNCTLANNVGWGIARPTLAGLTVKNSIFWGNTLGGIGHNQNLSLTFTDSQDAWATALGVGNFSADPLFVNAADGDYHEQGVEGSWHGGNWDADSRNSPCLDTGDPASDWSLEPKPCGNRINAGAYGNTAEATRSLPRSGTVLRIY